MRGDPFLVSLLPAFTINKAKRTGNTVPVEGTYHKESFISSRDDGVALFIKGQDKPVEMKSLRSPSTKSSSQNLSFTIEEGKQYEVANYVDTEYDGVLFDERIDIDGLCPDANHVHAIDLGLSVKWACCNVGATKPEEYGGYYQWGETLDPEDDFAHVKWGGSWRTPTLAEFEELYNSCTSEWTTLNGVYGRKFTSRKNGNSIFLPAAGCRGNGSLFYAGSNGDYWSSSLGTSVYLFVPFQNNLL